MAVQGAPIYADRAPLRRPPSGTVELWAPPVVGKAKVMVEGATGNVYATIVRLFGLVGVADVMEVELPDGERRWYRVTYGHGLGGA